MVKKIIKEYYELAKDIPKNICNIRNFVRALTTLIPMLERIIYAAKDEKELKNILWTIKFVDAEINKKIEIIDKNKINSEDFKCMLRKALDELKYTATNEKIHMMSNILINSIISTRNINFNYFLNRIISLEIEHIQILKWYEENNYSRMHMIGSKYDSDKPIELGDISKYYMSLENDLNVNGFLIETSNQGSERKRYYISNLGIELLKLIYYNPI